MVNLYRGDIINIESLDRVEYPKPISNEYLLTEGDILLNRTSLKREGVGKAAMIKHLPEKCYFDCSIIRVRPDKSKVIPEYLLYALNSPCVRPQITRVAKTATITTISQPGVQSLRIPLPPLHLQQKIVEILDRADRTRRLNAEVEGHIDEFLKSVFLEMFGDPMTNPKGWEIKKIGDVVALSQYGTSMKSNTEGRGYPLIGMGNVTYDGRLNLSSYTFIDLPEREYQKLKLKKGDILFNRTNSTELIGKTTYWNKNMDAVLASYLVKLKLKPFVNPVFFSFLMNTLYFKKLFMVRCKKGVNQSNINPTRLKQFEIYVPPPHLQLKFATIVGKMEEARSEFGKSTNETEELFNALMQKAFNGELVA